MNDTINEYIDNREQHQDYYTLIEEYYETELFKEIIHFMNIAFPEWKTNKGIGFWAGEFILNSILNNEYLTDVEEFSQRDLLITLYSELEIEYKKCKNQYTFVFNDSIMDEFNIECKILLDEKEHLNDLEYSIFYNQLFYKFKSKKLLKITYDFESELIY
tara:strand:- start:89372 stop:89851 length:480 start_codon:yes stop_codon:yes gene_type:complete